MPPKVPKENAALAGQPACATIPHVNVTDKGFVRIVRGPVSFLEVAIGIVGNAVRSTTTRSSRLFQSNCIYALFHAKSRRFNIRRSLLPVLASCVFCRDGSLKHGVGVRQHLEVVSPCDIAGLANSADTTLSSIRNSGSISRRSPVR